MFTEQVQLPREERREQTDGRILEAAAVRFAADGYRAATIRAIAAQAGVSVGRVMAVGDKETLLAAVYDRRIAAVHRSRADRPSDPDQSAPQRISELVAPFVELFADDQALARDYAAVLARGTVDSEIFGDLARTLLGEFEQVLAQAGAPDPAAGARALYFGYLGLLLSAAGVGGDLAQVQPQLAEITTTLLRKD